MSVRGWWSWGLVISFGAPFGTVIGHALVAPIGARRPVGGAARRLIGSGVA
ncbi:hypothetical protein MSMEG_2709 [Mycolicibacterium smegmatis MC2 155]|uniref:Uncharacterized protein n=1 Tax=Mycolicibacterium smegmatis (strain ATCC 700084 / mc(2)155) TaxID=246196 RepID=A0QVV4_MYCS2|nr:hypothetical protein MSMEG_2709 [Mycolicibacterium smegmatis MC2 155]